MIIIKKNITENKTFTLNEKAVSLTHDWVFVFKHEMTGEIKTFSYPDISEFESYNEFEFNETELDLRLGDHTYKVYEMPVSSPVDLDITNAYGIAETGKVNVYDPSQAEPNEFNVDDTKNSGEFNEE